MHVKIIKTQLHTLHGKLKRHDSTQCIKIVKDTTPHCMGNSKDKLHTMHVKIINTQLNVALKNYKDTTQRTAWEIQKTQLYTMHRKTIKKWSRTEQNMEPIGEKCKQELWRHTKTNYNGNNPPQHNHETDLSPPSDWHAILSQSAPALQTRLLRQA